MAIIFLSILGLVACSVVVWTLLNGISPMPTSRKVKNDLFKVIPKGCLGSIYELGCGWGTLLIPLAGIYGTSKIIGLETSPLPYLVSRIRVLLSPYSSEHISVCRRDIYSEDLSDAGLIVCYLYPGAMEKLKQKFDAELKPGTYIVSHTFAVPNWTPERIVEVDDLYKTKIYIYRK